MEATGDGCDKARIGAGARMIVLPPLGLWLGEPLRHALDAARLVAGLNTIEIVCTAGYKHDRSSIVRWSAAPSLTPGQSTTCVFAWIPIAPNRRNCSQMSGAVLLPSM